MIVHPSGHMIVILVALMFAGAGLLMLVAPEVYSRLQQWLHRLSSRPRNSAAAFKIPRALADSRKARLWIRLTGVLYLVVICTLCFFIFRAGISAK